MLNREENQYQEKLLKISRVSKTTKGGRTISFSVLAAVGDGEGKIGLGLGKANGVPDAIKKAIAAAKKNVVKVSLKNKTVPCKIELAGHARFSRLLACAASGRVRTKPGR